MAEGGQEAVGSWRGKRHRDHIDDIRVLELRCTKALDLTGAGVQQQVGEPARCGAGSRERRSAAGRSVRNCSKEATPGQ